MKYVFPVGCRAVSRIALVKPEKARQVKWHLRFDVKRFSLCLCLPPLAALHYKVLHTASAALKPQCQSVHQSVGNHEMSS